MNTTERLQQYYPFNDEILESVSETATWQNQKGFKELAGYYGIEGGAEVVSVPGHKYPLEVLTLKPRGDYDPTKARVSHTTMAYGINDIAAMSALRLFGADPTEQMIVIGNPNQYGNRAGKMTLRESIETARDLTLEPSARPTLAYLESIGVERTDQLGYSYGADKAAVCMAASSDYSQEVLRGVLAEPASSVHRDTGRIKAAGKLAAAFFSTMEHEQEYIKQSASKPHFETRQESEVAKLWYSTGLFRATNIAIAVTLAQDGFKNRVDAALAAQEGAGVTIAWGTESELAPDEEMQTVVHSLRQEHEGRQISKMRLKGMHHAGLGDIDLHAAIMLNGLRLAETGNPRPA